MKIRYGLLALGGLLAGALLLVVTLAPRVTGRQPADPAEPWMPIVIEFNRPIDPDSVAGRFALEPEVDGQLRVDGQSLIFEPDWPLDYNQRYTVTLKAGLSGRNRLPLLRGESWSFELSPPELLYLLEQDGVVDLWRVDAAGQASRLTDEALGVWDYAPLPDGRGLIYSTMDESDESLDLVLLGPDGARELLLDCHEALCRAPAVQPGGRLVAYERQPLEASLTAAELWLLDLDTGQTRPMPLPEALSGAGFDAPLGRYPAWSPDGRRLAAYRSDANMVVILDFSRAETAGPLTIPANLETMAGWSADGRSLAYTELAFADNEPHEHVDEAGTVISHTRPSLYDHVVVADVEAMQASDLSAGLERSEGRPAWHPSLEMLAVARTATGAGRQLWLVPLDGGPETQLTDDPFFDHTALAWSPDGQALAFMRVPRSDGAGMPTVMLYDMESGAMRPIADGAFLPGWWP